MAMNMMNWVDEIIAAEQKKGLLVLSFPAIQKMGITVKELINSSDLQAQAMKTVADETPEAAASVSFMDLSVEAEAFGSTIHVSDDEVPTVIGSIVSEEEDADALVVPEVGAGRTKLYLEAMAKAYGALPLSGYSLAWLPVSVILYAVVRAAAGMAKQPAEAKAEA